MLGFLEGFVLEVQALLRTRRNGVNDLTGARLVRAVDSHGSNDYGPGSRQAVPDRPIAPEAADAGAAYDGGGTQQAGEDT